MRRFSRLLLLGLTCFALGLLPRVAARSLPSAQGESVAAAWSASETDRVFFDGLDAHYKAVDAAVAPVLTDDRPQVDRRGRIVGPGLRTRVIQFLARELRGIETTRERFLEEKLSERHLPPGTSLGYDGVSFVPTQSHPVSSKE